MSRQDQSGYKFTEKDKSQVRDVLERVHRTTGATVSAETGSSAGFAAAFLGIDDAALGFKGNVVMIQSWRDADGAIRFSALSAADKQPVSSHDFHDTFLEALVFGDVFLRQVIEGFASKREIAKARAEPTTPEFPANIVKSKVLGPEEVQYVQRFANSLGQAVGLAGFANFVEARAGVLSIALGVISKDQPIMLGTVVVVSDDSGTSCSVRDFQNNPMPGVPYYESVYLALVTTRSYFERLATLTAKHLRPSWLARLFGR